MKKVFQNKWLGLVFCVLLAGLFLTGCASKSQMKNLEQKIQNIEATSNQALEKAEAAQVDAQKAEEYSMDAAENAEMADKAAQDAQQSADKAERMAEKSEKIFDKVTSK
ncbi:MAG: Lpp/OprI family alanine-zipper lipoprotein [Desulfovermiculus sp.]